MPESRNRHKHHHHQPAPHHHPKQKAKRSAALVVTILAATLGLAVVFFTQGAYYVDDRWDSIRSSYWILCWKNYG